MAMLRRHVLANEGRGVNFVGKSSVANGGDTDIEKVGMFERDLAQANARQLLHSFNDWAEVSAPPKHDTFTVLPSDWCHIKHATKLGIALCANKIGIGDQEILGPVVTEGKAGREAVILQVYHDLACRQRIIPEICCQHRHDVEDAPLQAVAPLAIEDAPDDQARRISRGRPTSVASTMGRKSSIST